MTVDFHCHTRASDGVLSPEQLAALMRGRGVRIFSITDHDTLRAYDGLAIDFARLVPGIEINTTWRGDDVHVLGYGFPLGDTPLRSMLEANRTHRLRRVERMLAGLAAAGYPLPFADVEAQSKGGDALGRPHVAKALIAAGYARDVDAAFRDLLGAGKPGYQPSHHVTPIEAVEAILASGGIPVLAHPGRLKDESILDALVEAGLRGLEVFYGTHSRAQVAHFRARAAHFGLVMTAGSDFHDATWQVRTVGMDVEPEDIAAFLELLSERSPEPNRSPAP